LPAGVSSTTPSAPAQLGIEIAPIAAVDELAAVLKTSSGNSSNAVVAQRVDIGKVAEKIVKNLFNYLHSFGDVKLTPETPIPLSVFQRWYDNFNRKIANDRGAAFLDRED
jgi:hypothetical protein